MSTTVLLVLALAAVFGLLAYGLYAMDRLVRRYRLTPTGQRALGSG